MVVYLDNAATSWPKPPEVARAMEDFSREAGANPGRSGHRRSIAAGRTVYGAREAVAELFNLADPLRVVFGLNGTEALNLALQGLLRPGDHLVTSSVEHNSVMRPLQAMAAAGVRFTRVRNAPDGTLDPALIAEAIQPETRMIVLNHASNVNGALQPVAAAGRIARERGLLLLVDAAATAGSVPIDMAAQAIDLVAFTGHKHLYGPMGTGGLAVGERVPVAELRPLKRGGTGSRSEEETQPEVLPDLYESGTLNALGLAGLEAGVRWVLAQGVDRIRRHQVTETGRWLAALGEIPGVDVQGPAAPERRTGVISFTIEGMSPSEIGLRLDEEHGLLCRVGLHCAPAAHRIQGTFPTGSVRIAPGCFTTEEERRRAVTAVAALAREAAR